MLRERLGLDGAGSRRCGRRAWFDVPPRRAVRYLLSGAFDRLAYYEWGIPAAPPVVCVHGLTRTGRDFDALAEGLADRFQVICGGPAGTRPLRLAARCRCIEPPS